MDRSEHLRRLAARQHALVARAQAVELGYDRWAVRRLVDSGAWEWATPRVLRLAGAAPDPRAPLMAGTLDGGPGTVVGRRAGAALWALPGFTLGPVEVCRQKGRSSRPPSLGRLFTVRYLPEHLTTEVAGIPVVTLPYLLFQLAGFLPRARVERLLATVVTRSPAVLGRLHELLPELAERGRDGIVVMRELLERNPPGSAVVASGLEARFERILAEAGEPPLQRQVDLGGHDWIGRVDFLDRAAGTVFEVDSDAYHAAALDRQLDVRRDAALRAAGFHAVVRIPEAWVWHEPARAVAAVRDARRRYAAARHRPPPRLGASGS